VAFKARKAGEHCVLSQVSLDIAPGKALGLVGESGSGKTVLAHSILGLLPRNGRVGSGTIEFNGQNLLSLPESSLRKIRGKEIAMIFQDPQASLNPVYPVGRQIEWVLKLHRELVGAEARNEVLRLLESVKLRDPKRCAQSYPHELSGGMCQRIMIAMALACRPKLLIADEPTSALDVTTQAEIVTLLEEIVATYDMALLFVSHDLGLVSHLCASVVVLRNGRVAESGATQEVLSRPSDAYTKKLITAARLHQIPA
jgi:ABC-type dipeptide/oligopeptide/nickel transport system ATPase component